MPVTIRLLGSFSVQVEGRPLGPLGTKSSALLAFLAAREDWVERGELAALLYAELDASRARRNLRQLLQGLMAVPGLEREGRRVRWRVDSDLARFRAHAERGDAEAAVAEWGGDLLADLPALDEAPFLDWLDLERERLRGTWRSLAFDLAERHEERGDLEKALLLLRRILAQDPLDEPAVARSMRALAAAGRAAEALRYYRSFAQRLEDELDVQPTAATVELARHLEAGKGVRPPRPPGAAPPLPRADHPLVGRDGEVAAVDAAFAAGARWVTLTGLGGSGKSRLALAVAERWARSDRVAWIDASAAASEQDLYRALASACGVAPADRPADRAALASVLGEGPTLVVLDDPYDPDIARRVVSTVLDTAPAARVLATARRELAAAGERVHPIGGLDERASADLILAVAAHMRSAPRSEGEARRHARRIGRAVGGLPLALHVATGWLAVIPLAELADRVEASRDWLAEADPERRLGAVLDRTLAALDGDEADAFARLGAFAGPFEPEAARAIGVPLPLVLRFLRRGLLGRRVEGRIGLHPLVAERARAALDRHAERADVQRRHADHVLGEVATAPLQDERRPRALRRLEASLPDARRAWGHAVATGQHDLLASALDGWANWHESSARRDELARSVGAAAQDAPPLHRARFRFEGARIVPGAEEDATIEACLAVFEEEGDDLDAARALEALAIRAVERDEYAAGARAAQRGLRLARRADAPDLEASLLNIAAVPALTTRAYADAEALYRRAVGLAERGALLAADRARANWALLRIALGRPREAIALAEASLRLAVTRHDPVYRIRRHHVLGHALRAAGEDDVAEAAFRRQLRRLDRPRLDPGFAAHMRWLALRHVTRLLGATGRVDEARALLHDAAQPHGAHAWARAAWIGEEGWLALRVGALERAESLLAEAVEGVAGSASDHSLMAARWRVLVHRDAAACALARGDLASARRRGAAALAHALDADLPPLLLDGVATAAAIELHEHRQVRACRLLARVVADPRTHGETRRDARRLQSRAGHAPQTPATLDDARLARLAASLRAHLARRG